MNIEFKCPQCGQMVATDEAYRGKVVQCPKCEKGMDKSRHHDAEQIFDCMGRMKLY